MTTILVVAKAPVPGRVKTRLAVDIGADAAARVAAAALLDTVRACTSALGRRRCRLALDGELADAVDATPIRRALDGWSVVPQGAGDLGERIAAAFGSLQGPVVQIGMDTPQVSTVLLREAAGRLDDHDAVLGDAEDGGWWLLGLRDPARAGALASVPMSTAHTGASTREALEASGLRVAGAPVLRDVDELSDLRAVAAAYPALLTSAEAAMLP
jgi:hypothetical protein